MKLSLDMIKTDVNYTELCFFESHLTHELKRLGKQGFIDSYKNYRIYTDFEKRALLMGYLEYLGYICEDKYDIKYFILEPYSYLDFKDGDFLQSDLEDLYNSSLDSFKKYGFLFTEIGGFADGTFN